MQEFLLNEAGTGSVKSGRKDKFAANLDIDIALIYNLNSDKSESLLKKISMLGRGPNLDMQFVTDFCTAILLINILSLITGPQPLPV